MSNRLTFGEAEFLLHVLREARGGMQVMRKLTPADCEAMAAFGDFPCGNGMSDMPVREWREGIDDRLVKLDAIILKVEGLLGL